MTVIAANAFDQHPPLRQNRFLSDGALSRLFPVDLRHLGVTSREELSRAAGVHTRCWELFLRDSDAIHLHERFDHMAAAFYVFAEDPPLSAEQKKKIRRLLFRRKMLTSSPLVTSWEEQDPYFGRWVLSTLCYGEYGEFKIVNNNHPRLNNPPSTLPPREADVHLCWGIGSSGAAQASVLQALVALLLEDWRSALRRFDFRFHLHRLSPRPRTLHVGIGGHRWRDLGGASLPPHQVMGTCFLRPSYADIAINGNWTVPRSIAGDRSWRCLALLENDLPSLGFSRAAATGIGGFTGGGWYAPVSTLPLPMDHVVVVSPQEGSGVFLKVVPMGKGIRLDPVRTLSYSVKDKDYMRLRLVALDILLEELWTRTA